MFKMFKTGMEDLDLSLGGGFPKGSIVSIIGESKLALDYMIKKLVLNLNYPIFHVLTTKEGSFPFNKDNYEFYIQNDIEDISWKISDKFLNGFCGIVLINPYTKISSSKDQMNAYMKNIFFGDWIMSLVRNKILKNNESTIILADFKPEKQKFIFGSEVKHSSSQSIRVSLEENYLNFFVTQNKYAPPFQKSKVII